MAFSFRNEDERIAIEHHDADIYQHMGACHVARWDEKSRSMPQLCQGVTEAVGFQGIQRSGMRPLTLGDLQVVRQTLNSLYGNWSILWRARELRSGDVKLSDSFRPVVVILGIEFAMRPDVRARIDHHDRVL